MAPSADQGKVSDYVDAEDVHTYYEVVGRGDPLLLLHGGLCAIETISGLTERLAEHYRVYLPERRAHGRTPDVDGPITYDLMARDTIAFLDAVGMSSAHFVGWSDGAVVALLVAMQRPDLVRRLVMIGTHVNPEGLPSEVHEMMKLDAMPPEALPPVLRELYAGVSPDGPDHWDVVVDKEWQMLRSEPNIALEELAKVSAPTLLLVAEHDFPTLEHSEAMSRSFPNGELQVVPDADHGMPMEKPSIVAGHVIDFLGR